MRRSAPPQGLDWCDDPAHSQRVSRRELLRVGALGGLGLTLGEFFALRSARGQESPAPSAPADSVIQIFLEGGLSHIDSFDPKPDAAIEIRGELGAVQACTGEHLGGLLARTGQIADKLAIIRSFTHTEAAHERGQHSMLTGYQPNPALVYPAIGAVVSHLKGPRNNLPPYVAVPGAGNPWLSSGYLSSAYGPFSLGADPVQGDFAVRDLSLPAGVDDARATRRRALLDAVNAHFQSLERAEPLEAMNAFNQRAYDLISSQPAREAFNINAEDAGLRDEYGRSDIGQRLLMARRLVEAGVRFVTVLHGGWDMHQRIRDSMNGLLPAVDQAFSALIRDLDRRGLLTRTLVVLSSEFGRTPRLNRDGGRDHWPKVFSVVLAGGGIQGGRILGASDPTGAEPADRPVKPADLAATVFTQLGIAPDGRLMSAGNRPVDIVRHGTLIRELL